jgi:hypothetical protein
MSNGNMIWLRFISLFIFNPMFSVQLQKDIAIEKEMVWGNGSGSIYETLQAIS